MLRALQAQRAQLSEGLVGHLAGYAAHAVEGVVVEDDQLIVGGDVHVQRDAEAVLIRRALKAAEGSKSRAAELLGITREGLRKKLQRMEAEGSLDEPEAESGYADAGGTE